MKGTGCGNGKGGVVKKDRYGDRGMSSKGEEWGLRDGAERSKKLENGWADGKRRLFQL